MFNFGFGADDRKLMAGSKEVTRDLWDTGGLWEELRCREWVWQCREGPLRQSGNRRRVEEERGAVWGGTFGEA